MNEAPLGWTSKKEWGIIGHAYYAHATMPGTGDTWWYTVDQPRRGHWAVRGRRHKGDDSAFAYFAYYSEAKTLREARDQAQAHANLAATQTCGECERIAGHESWCCVAVNSGKDSDK